MTIAEVRGKCKSFVGRVPRDVLIVGVLVLTSSASFGLGYLAGLDAGGTSKITPEAAAVPTATTTGQFVASKSGTKYYPPGCAGANRISETNKVWFASAAAATNAGYALAASCGER
jgi:hypothetical protein